MQQRTLAARAILGLGLALAIVVPSAAVASVNLSTIFQIIGFKQDYAWIKLTSNPNGIANCGPEPRYVISLRTEGGRANFALALAAKLAGRQVLIIGSGLCGDGITLPADAEEVDSVVIADP